jgi:Zn-dependent M28 family amino/carboxypeptidase
MEGRASFTPSIARAADFIAEEFKIAQLDFFENESYLQQFKTEDGKDLFNVVGVLKGKSKPEEFVVFSAHYDHVGIIKPMGMDSIANGADDNASGVAAVIALAKAYRKLNNNERTLVFVAFTAEEIGGFGSKYFSTQMDPDAIKAMINIEMIGKDSKFGPNSVFITGFERSNLGELMQERVKGTSFTFYPDPYPDQRLFFRSDNATLARLGVPAHSFSTVQLPTDTFYHTVKDEFETLDVDNIVSTINAIFIGAKGLVDGSETPTRIVIKP